MTAARLCAALALAGGAAPAVSQPPPQPPRAPLQFEVRLDVIRASPATIIHAGLGLTRQLGTYVRASAVGAAGVAHRNGDSEFSARGDLVFRLTPDPFRQSRYAPFVAVGLSGRRDAPGEFDVFLLLVAGVEGPEVLGSLPSIEVGYAGGLRAGLVLRRARPNRR